MTASECFWNIVVYFFLCSGITMALYAILYPIVRISKSLSKRRRNK